MKFAILGSAAFLPPTSGGQHRCVTRQAVEIAAGRSLDDLEFHAWVVEHDERIRTIGDHVRPKPTAKGARVYTKIHHFT